MNQKHQFSGKALMYGAMLLLTTPLYAVNLSVNNSNPLNLSDDVNLDTIDDTFELKIEEPVVCHFTSTSTPSARLSPTQL